LFPRGVQIHDVSAPDSSVSSFMKPQSYCFWGVDSISAGEEFPPSSNALFDFGGGDSWPQTCVQNSGNIKKLRELLSVDWIPGEDS